MRSLSVRPIVPIAGLLLSGLIATGSDQAQPSSTSGPPAGTGAVKLSRVAAQVIASNAPGAAQPERQAGAFTIPKGSLGVNLEYRYRDPNTDYSSTTLSGNNLYSITENRYLRELESVPIYKLPPGDYRFEVGGTPGAHGELTITVVPGTPPTKTNVTKTSPPTTDVNPPRTSKDDEISATLKAIDRAWSGLYTIEKVTGNVEGLGQVLGKRAFHIKMRPDEAGLYAEGAVWMPPGWFGHAAGGAVDPGRIIHFYVASKETDLGCLLISYKGVYDPKTDSIKGTLIGNRVKGDSSDPVFEGSWYLKPR